MGNEGNGETSAELKTKCNDAEQSGLYVGGISDRHMIRVGSTA